LPSTGDVDNPLEEIQRGAIPPTHLARQFLFPHVLGLERQAYTKPFPLTPFLLLPYNPFSSGRRLTRSFPFLSSFFPLLWLRNDPLSTRQTPPITLIPHGPPCADYHVTLEMLGNVGPLGSLVPSLYFQYRWNSHGAPPSAFSVPFPVFSRHRISVGELTPQSVPRVFPRNVRSHSSPSSFT